VGPSPLFQLLTPIAQYAIELGKVIDSFRCKETEKLWQTGRSRKFGSIAQVAKRKLMMLNNAADLRDLKVPPGNQLEALKDERKGQHSIRINDQYRVCFIFKEGNAYNVEIVDYH
jgi:toxin HigB-1